MALMQEKFLLSCLVIFSSLLLSVSSRGAVYRPPTVERLTDRFPRIPITQGMSTLFGASNVHVKSNGSYADIILDKTSGSGLISKNKYYHGFFNAAIKLPAGFTSGVVLAFYVSSRQHTGTRGDPQCCNFFCVPIKANVTIRNHASEWATNGGKYPVNYKYAPFVASLGQLEIIGCSMHQANNSSMANTVGCLKNATISSLDPVDGEEYAKLTKQQMVGLNWVRSKHMYYSYCKDTTRYKVMPAECNYAQ